MSTKKLTLSYIFEASPKDLWEAWTDPKQYAKWFNPTPGYDLIIHKFDVRVGGLYKFDMPQPNGDLMSQEGIFHVLNPYKEIVLGAQDKSYLIEANFEKIGRKTKMIVNLTGIPPEYLAGAPQVWKGGFKKLENLLQTTILIK